MGLPNPSRETKFSGANGDKEYFMFPVQLADREQDWQPCPVVMLIPIHKLYVHTAVVTHLVYAYLVYLYSSEPCTNIHVEPR